MYNSYGSRTTLGISERWERVLCYVFGWLSGLVMFLIERENHNVRRHAAQSMLVFGGLSILGSIVSILGHLFGGIWVIGPLFALGFGFVGWILGLVGIILWALFLVMAFLTPNFFLPLGRTYDRLLG